MVFSLKYLSDKCRLHRLRREFVLRPDGAFKGDADGLDGHGVFKRDAEERQPSALIGGFQADGVGGHGWLRCVDATIKARLKLRSQARLSGKTKKFSDYAILGFFD
jgi:hypothetical protein